MFGLSKCQSLTISLLVLLIIEIYFLLDHKTSLWRNDYSPDISPAHSKASPSSSFPTIARVLYLYLCETQAEMNAYTKSLPSVSADILFYCWRENCVHPHRQFQVFVLPWNTSMRQTNLPFIRLTNDFRYRSIHSNIIIINNKTILSVNAKRNAMFQVALEQEQRQGWKWSYFVVNDGDAHISCPRAKQFQLVNNIHSEEHIFKRQFLSFLNSSGSRTQTDERICFHLFDAFLLTVAPALAIPSETSGPMFFPNLLTQTVYHVDAIINAVQHDAIPYILPYCTNFDKQSWWTAQAVFVYRSLCLFGHALQFDGVQMKKNDIHRSYPHSGNPFEMVLKAKLDLYPQSLNLLREYLQERRALTPVILEHYTGWDTSMVMKDCTNYTNINETTCRFDKKDIVV